jgi:hypothetical protein
LNQPLPTPRVRFRAYLDSGDRRFVIPALAGLGLAQVSSQIVVLLTQEQKAVAEIPRSGWYAYLIILPILMVLGAWLNAVLLRWTGRLVGGQATVRELLTAMAWSVMPVALVSPLIAAEALALIRGAADPDQAGGLPGFASALVSLLSAVTFIMAFYRLVISISEVQRFSKLRALGNIALSVAPFFALAVLALLLGGKH